MKIYNIENLQTGWFGIPGGSISQSSKVHITQNEKPICGTRLNVDMEFQLVHNGIAQILSDNECKHCCNIIKRKLVSDDQQPRLARRCF